MQPDQVVGIASPQSLNRFSYVLNNPINRNDPSGYVSCHGDNWDDGPQCAQSTSQFYGEYQTKGKAQLQKSIKEKYHWNISSDFSVQELGQIYQTGMDIESYVNKLTGGDNGLVWMNRTMSGTTINPVSTLPWFLKSQAYHNTSWPNNSIYLAHGFNNWGIAHELAEIWDLHSSSSFGALVGYRGGVADALNAEFGGGLINNPRACRYCNVVNPDGSYGIDPNNPQAHLWQRGAYANSSTEDYFSEAFSNMLYQNQGNGPIPARVQSWMENYIQYSLLLNP